MTNRLGRWMAAGLLTASAGITGCGGGSGAAYAPTENPTLWAVAWQQNAAEYRANAMSVYVAAKGQLDAALADTSWTAATEQTGDFASKPPAIILDVDETVLDNSPFQARAIHTGVGYPEGWAAWCKEARATPVPGALALTRYAASKGVTVFYVTNRDVDLDEATTRNLAEQGFPMAKDAEGKAVNVVLTANETDKDGSEKTARRALVAKDYRVIMLFGDNLGDFITKKGGAKADAAARAKAITDNAERWGRQWFMLPNPMYGYWADVQFGYKYDQPEDWKRQQMVEKLRPMFDEKTLPSGQATGSR